MKKDTKIYLILGAIVILIIIGIFWMKKNGETSDEKTAKCIAGKSTLYVATGCGFCAQQEKLFGDYASLLNKVDCVYEPKKCADSGIKGTPTWIINNQSYSGVKTIQELQNIAGC